MFLNKSKVYQVIFQKINIIYLQIRSKGECRIGVVVHATALTQGSDTAVCEGTSVSVPYVGSTLPYGSPEF